MRWPMGAAAVGTDPEGHPSSRLGTHLQVLDEVPRKAPGGKGRVHALGGEVVQALEVGVHDDVLLVRVLEGLHAGQAPLVPRGDARAPPQARQVPPHQVQQHRLRDVVRIVPCAPQRPPDHRPRTALTAWLGCCCAPPPACWELCKWKWAC